MPPQQFTGQRLDTTGLYYYGARYYDPTIGRFISPDTIVPSYMNPQSFNRYSYCLNNPLKYTDPSGHDGGYTVQLNSNGTYLINYGNVSIACVKESVIGWMDAIDSGYLARWIQGYSSGSSSSLPVSNNPVTTTTPSTTPTTTTNGVIIGNPGPLFRGIHLKACHSANKLQLVLKFQSK